MLAKFDRVVGIAEDAVAIGAFSVILVLVVAQVFLRYVLNSGFIWVDELVSIFMVAMVMFGTAGATRRLMHTSLQFLIDLMPKTGKLAARMLIGAIGLAFLGIFLYASFTYAMDAKGLLSTVMKIPLPLIYSLLPAGAALTFYEYAKSIPAFVRSEKEGA
jgi:TRAP-type C4-dicarboxylate transport system permease small subunit